MLDEQVIILQVIIGCLNHVVQVTVSHFEVFEATDVSVCWQLWIHSQVL